MHESSQFLTRDNAILIGLEEHIANTKVTLYLHIEVTQSGNGTIATLVAIGGVHGVSVFIAFRKVG